jgi:hypothetical protein
VFDLEVVIIRGGSVGLSAAIARGKAASTIWSSMSKQRG